MSSNTGDLALPTMHRWSIFALPSKPATAPASPPMRHTPSARNDAARAPTSTHLSPRERTQGKEPPCPNASTAAPTATSTPPRHS